jgi:hypothetical protein
VYRRQDAADYVRDDSHTQTLNEPGDYSSELEAELVNYPQPVVNAPSLPRSGIAWWAGAT